MSSAYGALSTNVLSSSTFPQPTLRYSVIPKRTPVGESSTATVLLPDDDGSTSMIAIETVTARSSRPLSIHHLRLEVAPPSLVAFLHDEFVEELERGNTYPQELPMDREAFERYFFAADVFVGVLGSNIEAPTTNDASGDPQSASVPATTTTTTSINPAEQVPDLTFEAAQALRPWDECLVGAYYVKPNYPGRSSHVCNAGFLITHRHRGGGYGKTLGQSYLVNAPKLGYKASVFNLVFANNIGSLKIWDSLGFKRVGLIPGAGRLRRADGEGDEYVDAVVVWKSFEE